MNIACYTLTFHSTVKVVVVHKRPEISELVASSIGEQKKGLLDQQIVWEAGVHCFVKALSLRSCHPRVSPGGQLRFCYNSTPFSSSPSRNTSVCDATGAALPSLLLRWSATGGCCSCYISPSLYPRNFFHFTSGTVFVFTSHIL